MTPTVRVDTRNFQMAWRKYLAVTSRSLPQAINSRMFFVLVRAYLILPPKSPVSQRKKFRDDLTQLVKPRNNPSREVLKLYAIVNSGRRPGLYGKRMAVAAGKVMARAIGGVGYLRALTVRGIKGFQSFRQFGTKRLKTGKYGGANKAAVTLASKYDTQKESVAIYRNSSAKAISFKAQNGFSPVASVQISGASPQRIAASGQNVLRTAFVKSFADETVELEQYLLAKLADDAKTVTEPLGILVKP